MKPRLIKSGPRCKLPFGRDPLQPTQKVLILSSFFHLANLSASRAGQQALVLLSSCGNHVHTFNSCGYNVEYALRGKNHNLDKVLSNLETLDLDKILSPLQQPLFSDSGAKAALLANSLGREKGQLLEDLSWIGQSLQEYVDKKKLFEEDFEEIKEAIASVLRRTRDGKLFYEQMIERRGLLDSSRQGDVARKFDYLDHCEQLVWALYNVCKYGLAFLGVSEKALEPSMALTKLREFSAGYNDLVVDQESIYGVYLRTTFDPQLIESFQDDWVQSWPKLLATLRKCYGEIVEFFEIYVPVYEPEDYLKFYPKTPGNNRTVTGYLELRLRDQFVLFMDMIRSKRSPPEVKDHICDVLQKHKAWGLYSQVTSNDAFLAVSDNWNLVVAAAEASCNRVTPYLAADGFGGLRKAMTFGSLLMLKNESTGETIPKDDDEPVVPDAAYLCEKIDEVLRDNSRIQDKDPNRWLVLTDKAYHASEVRGAELADSVDLGQVRLKGGVEIRAWALPHGSTSLVQNV